MNLQSFVDIGRVAYPIIAGLIIVIFAAIAGYGFYIMANAAIDKYQELTRRNRNIMATPMRTDEILAKRLERASRRKSETMRFAGRI